MFFTHISQLMTQGVDLTIVIRRKENELIVSTLPKSNGLKDDAQHHIVPLTLTGTPAELDAGFMQTIAQPVQKATGLIVNLEQFEQQMTKASANSKAAKEAQAKESKEEKEKRERCEKSIKRADELIAVQKFDEALSNLQQARLYATEQISFCGYKLHYLYRNKYSSGYIRWRDSGYQLQLWCEFMAACPAVAKGRTPN